MTRAQWAPFAVRKRYDITHPGVYMPTVSKVVLHTTEGVSLPSYGGGGSAPTFTVVPDFDRKAATIYQHFPANMSAKALKDKAGGVRTNRDSVAQIEIVGTSGWATTRNPNRDYTLPEKYFSGTFPDWYLAAIARIVRWLHDEWDVPYRLPSQPFGPWQGSRRMGQSEYDSYTGILGHCHVPENDHTDPGPINAARILQLAKTGTPATPAPTQEDLDMTPDQLRSTLTAWAKSPEGKAAIQAAVASTPIGRDKLPSGQPRTLATDVQDTYWATKHLARKLGVEK